MHAAPTPADRLQSTARNGVILTTAVLILLSAVIAYSIWTALSDSMASATFLMDQLDLDRDVPVLGRLQTLAATGMWLLPDALAFVMLLYTRALFAGIRTRGIFTRITAQRLRSIGWLVFALGPFSVVTNFITGILLNAPDGGGGMHFNLSIDDADFYAMVVGLVVVAVGHIMVDAAELHKENKAFI